MFAGKKRPNKKKITQVTSDNMDSTHTQIELNRQQLQHRCAIMRARTESSDAYLIEFKVTLLSILADQRKGRKQASVSSDHHPPSNHGLQHRLI